MMDQNPLSTSDNWHQLKLLYRLKIGVDTIVKQMKVQDRFLDKLKCCVDNAENRQQQELADIYRDYRLIRMKFTRFSSSDVYNVICDLFMSFHQSSMESMLEDEDISLFDTNNADSQSFNDYNENSNAGMGGDEDDEEDNPQMLDDITGYEQVFSTPDLHHHRLNHSSESVSNENSYPDGDNLFGEQMEANQDKSLTGSNNNNTTAANGNGNGSLMGRGQQPFGDERIFRCDFHGCIYSSNRKDRLMSHKLTHNTERRYKCNISDCTYATNWSTCLRAHQQNHSLEADQKCDFEGCSFATYTQDVLTRHKLLVHDPERKFVCDFAGCLFKTYTRHCLNRHKLIHSAERNYKCDKCFYSTKRVADLNKHKLNHNAEPAYKCNVGDCSYGTNWLKCIKRHKQIHHMPPHLQHPPPQVQPNPQQQQQQQPQPLLNSQHSQSQSQSNSQQSQHPLHSLQQQQPESQQQHSQLQLQLQLPPIHPLISQSQPELSQAQTQAQQQAPQPTPPPPPPLDHQELSPEQSLLQSHLQQQIHQQLQQQFQQQLQQHFQFKSEF